MTRHLTFLICLFYVSDVSNALYLPELEIRQMIVNTHNTLRRKVATRWADKGLAASDMRKMRWDEGLATDAASMATCESLSGVETGYDYMSSSTSLGGDSTAIFYDDLVSMGNGKNVAVSPYGNIRQMVEGWSSQETHFNYKFQMCASGQNCDAFLQMIWSKASSVGCSLNPYCVQDGVSVKLLVCLYDKAASIFDVPYSVGEVCSQCGSEAGFCERDLCVPSCHGRPSEECGCLKTCHHPGIGEGVIDEESCTCNCLYGLGSDCQEVCVNPQQYLNFDFCADQNDPDSCERMPDWQRTTCPANCDYGCRTAP
ncbi:GLIPR1-like protein 1 [Asterias rubens]|uniref:GLIPR1-like protein 1 n=1 Tax=Asterias rubens TaxID=7604 RepID=UPI0014558A6A|nr:GLIPR1-like protein 1 [Asterias rubens]